MATTRKSPVKKSTAKKAVKKSTAKNKVAPAKKTPAKKAVKKVAPTKKAAKKTPAKKVLNKVASAPVAPDEKPWTVKELAALRAEIEADIAELETEIREAEADLLEMLQDSGDGTGDDQADAGAKTFEREQEISLANNARELLEQNQRALARMDDGSYGTCESCGNPIGKLRLQAAPRATLCMPCKMKQERR